MNKINFKDYSLKVYVPEELSQSSFFLTGLTEFSAKVGLKIKYINNFKKKKGRTIIDEGMVSYTEQEFPKTAYFELCNRKFSKTVFFAVDTYDFENQFSSYALENCDFVFKRNFSYDMVNHLPKQHTAKLCSLGLTFKVYSSYFTKNKRLKYKYLLTNIVKSLKIDSYLFKRLNKKLTYHKNQLSLLKNPRYINDYNNYSEANENIVFFQTRCFEDDSNNDVKEIHEQRYKIIKLLSLVFNNKFKGGFIKSKLATEKYSDALTNVPSEPHKYLKALKQAKVVIYTRGLAKSPAWKMAEYMSQAKVIIAEKLTTDLPVPLTHGKELLFFENNEELISNIKLVLENDKLANQLSINARAYFEKHIHPEQTVKRVLETVINEKL
ncbi:glycosyltransferase [Mesonia sediminis]|uniref:Glycosyltransferase n=1 Tax=Mesonia sediminis TaxID=1703946 RepID=A0ABW5SJ08_9FLAO